MVPARAIAPFINDEKIQDEVNGDKAPDDVNTRIVRRGNNANVFKVYSSNDDEYNGSVNNNFGRKCMLPSNNMTKWSYPQKTCIELFPSC